MIAMWDMHLSISLMYAMYGDFMSSFMIKSGHVSTQKRFAKSAMREFKELLS
jgi:uncharacterized protein YeeX (DUF496 family)